MLLDYKGVQDIVEMTGIWAGMTDAKHDNVDVAWPEAGFPVANWIALYGGCGLRPIINNAEAVNVIARTCLPHRRSPADSYRN